MDFPVREGVIQIQPESPRPWRVRASWATRTRLSAHAGQTIRIKFNGVEDASLQTSFALDDVSVQESRPLGFPSHPGRDDTGV